MMQEKPFKPIIINSQMRAHQIRQATSRIIYCAPGITEMEVEAVVAVQSKLPRGVVQLLLDLSVDSYKAGYWGDLTPARLAQLGLDFDLTRMASGLRLGILIVDDFSWIFTPTPQSVETESGFSEPNCLELNKETTQLLVSSIIAPDQQSSKKRIAINEKALNNIQDNIELANILSASKKRQLEIIRPLIKIIQFEIRGYRLTQHTIRLPREVINIIGSSNREINDRINADWKVFSSTAEVELEKYQKSIDREIGDLKERYLIRLGHYGFGLVQKEKSDFKKAWNKLENEQLKSFRQLIQDKYSATVAQSQNLLRTLLKERISKGTLNMPTQRMLIPLSEEEQISQYIDHVIQEIRWPTAEDILKRLVIKYREYDISEQLLNDLEFIKLFESYFGKLADIISKSESIPIKPVYDSHGFSLN
jgi:hypothetical protein